MREINQKRLKIYDAHLDSTRLNNNITCLVGLGYNRPREHHFTWELFKLAHILLYGMSAM